MKLVRSAAQCRLLEEMYTCEEVADVLAGVRTVVCTDVETELDNFTSSVGLLMKNVLEQVPRVTWCLSWYNVCMREVEEISQSVNRSRNSLPQYTADMKCHFK